MIITPRTTLTCSCKQQHRRAQHSALSSSARPLARESPTVRMQTPEFPSRCTDNLRTKILDFRGFDCLNFKAWNSHCILMFTGHFPELLSQQILVGIILVGRLGVASNLLLLYTYIIISCYYICIYTHICDILCIYIYIYIYVYICNT